MSRVFDGCRALFAPARAAATAATKKKPTSTTTTTSIKPSPKSPPKPKARTPNRTAGIFKVRPVSSALADIIGAPEASRAGSVSKIWSYIKTHNLQNPQDKRKIMCDEKLKAVFDGKDVVGFLEIGKLLSRHFV